jgi:hypothetical protein
MPSNVLLQGVENLGIAYSAGTFTIRGANGSSLASSNPAYVTLPSKATPGNLIRIPVKANQNFIDDAGASEIIGNLFGLTTGVAYAQDIPFFIYAVSNDAEDTIAFMISRIPHSTSSPQVTQIGAPDDAVADAQPDFWSLENIDETLYDGNPCICIGSFRMQMSALDDWTVQTLAFRDGIGKFQEGENFTFPTGVFGASAGTFILANGGTAPIFTTNASGYQIQKNGICIHTVLMNGDGGTDGTGAVLTPVTIPYMPTNNIAGASAQMIATQ